MATAKPKLVSNWTITGKSVSHSRTDIEVRDVDTTTDEPLERGGTNMGLSPVETVAAALLGCTNVITHKCAEKHGVKIQDMTIDADVTFDRRGTQLAEETRLPFPKIILHIGITTDASDDAIEKVKTDLPKYCPVSVMIRESGTEIEEIWTVTRP